MKKGILVGLSLCLALTLAACSRLLNEAAKETERPGAVVTPAGDGQEAPPEKTDGPEEPAQPEPSGVDAYGFTLWPEGNYLADPKFDTDEYLPNLDADPNSVQYMTTMHYAVTPTEDTVYSFPYGSGDHDNTVLLFTDKATGLTMPLCGKPECTHDNDTCNAYIGSIQIKGLCVYDGKLWWSQSTFNGPVLNRMDLDGTGRETVMKLNLDFLTEISGNVTWAIHRGYLYVGGQKDTVIDGKPGCAFIIYAQPLDGGEDITVLRREIVSGSDPWLCMKPVGNELYIMLQYGSVGSEGIDGIRYELFRWDSKTRKAEQLFSVRGDEYLFDSMVYPFPVPGDGVYLEESYFDNSGESVNAFTIYKYSFESKEIEKYSSFEMRNGVAMGFTWEHFIVRTYRDGIRSYVFDYEGNFVSESELLDSYYESSILFMTEDRDYVYYQCNEGPDGRSCILALPIEGGDLLVLR